MGLVDLLAAQYGWHLDATGLLGWRGRANDALAFNRAAG
jgi:hypothetical protein